MSEIRDRIVQALNEGKIDPRSTVQKLNDEAIKIMMQGETEGALSMFLAALRLSEPDDQSAQCLINIGDWVRRFTADLELAKEIFEMARQRASSELTKSRLRTMLAMVYGYRTTCGEPDPEGMAECITLLREGIGYAKLYSAIDPMQAFEAEDFAFHRLAGIVCNWGDAAQKAEFLLEIEQRLAQMESNSAEAARLHYSKAMIIVDQLPELACRLLVDSAARLRTESPADSGTYLILAAEIAFRRLGDKPRARELLEHARECLPVIRKFSLNKRYLDLYDELIRELK